MLRAEDGRMAPVMSSSLRDIPGAGSGRRRSGADRKASSKVRTRHVPVGAPEARGLKPSGPSRRRSFGSRQPVDRVNLIIGVSFAALAVIGALWLWNQNQVSVSASGIEPGATITPQEAVALAIEIEVSPTTTLGSAVLTFEGEDVTGDVNVETTDNGFIWHSPPGRGLEDGSYTIGLSGKRTIRGSYDWQLDFEVESPAVG